LCRQNPEKPIVLKKVKKILKQIQFASLPKSRSVRMEITMAITLNSTNAFVFGASATKTNKNFMQTNVERLASGKRINSAADDADGLAVLSKLEASLSGKEQAIRNSADGLGALQIADSGAAEVSNILNRMHELAVQASNGPTSIAEREAIQNEADQLTAEISRIADNVSFSGQNLLTGGEIDIQAGDTSSARLSVDIAAMTSSALGLDGGAVSFDTPADARSSIQAIDTSLAQVSATRGEIGAGISRVSSAISSLTDATKSAKIAAERQSAADSGEASTNLAKAQILEQTSTAMLAQGNASRQAVLQLMKS
jgi:flagellin